MEVDLKIEIEVKDKDGRVVKKVSSNADSFVSNFIHVLRGLTLARNTSSRSDTFIDLDGTVRYVSYLDTDNTEMMYLRAPDGNSRYGVVIGYGTTPVSKDDYKLESQAPSTDFDYNNSTIAQIQSSANEEFFRIIRTFTNISGSDKTISEIGLIARVRYYGGVNVFYLVARDILPIPVTVAANGNITVSYIIKITY